MKNWKSNTAFFIFVTLYAYTILQDKGVGIVEIAGYIALYSSIFMMFRSEFTASMLEKLIERFSFGK